MQTEQLSSRAGEYLERQAGYRAFVPRNLPPVPPLIVEDRLLEMLCAAERAMGRLSGYAESLEVPGGFFELAQRAEAVNSGRLDGAKVSLVDLLRWELDGRRGPDGDHCTGEVRMAANSVDAAMWGLGQVIGGQVGSGLMIQLHARLFKGLRGRDRGAGQLRTSEIWIGPSGSTLASAVYVPPPPAMVLDLMRSLERFIQADALHLPPLVRAACVYYQLDTIHPFLDGSGRLARLMIPLMLSGDRMTAPQLLSLSDCFARDRVEHFRRLQWVRERGDWEGWVAYFLGRMILAADDAVSRLSRAERFRRDHRQLVAKRFTGSATAALAVVDSLFVQPVVSVDSVAGIAGRTFANANLLVQRLEEMGLLTEVTGHRRNRRFCCQAYIRLLAGD